jgi:hypothetical protein
LKYADVDFISQAFTKRFLRSIPLIFLAVLAACGGTSSSNGGGGGGGQPALQSIQVTGVSLSILTSATDQFTATGIYSAGGGSKNLTSTATWTSSDITVATISSGGLVTAKAQGTTTITATSGKVTGSATLTVTATLVSIAVSPAAPAIAPGTTQAFKATGTYSDNSTQDITGTVTWSSSATGVATISNAVSTQGLASAVAHGTSTITATSGSISKTATLTVTNGVLQSIVVTPANSSITLGQVKQFTATGTFLDGSTTTTQDITNVSVWNSATVNIATITVSGVATGLKTGTTTITATWNSISGNTQLMVTAANLSSIAIQPGDRTIAQGTTIQYSAVGTFSDGSTRNITNQVVWASSNTAAATITNSTATGVSAGQTTISATLAAVSISGSVTLVVSNATVQSISVTPAGRSIAAGTQLSFIATGSFSDGSTQTITNDVTWASSNTSFARVSNTAGTKGIVTAVSTGSVTISGTLGTVKGSAALTVNSATLTSIALTPTEALLAPASTMQYTAIGSYSNGTTFNLNGVATWSSSTTSVATVTSFGQVTGQSAGTTSITAKMGSVTSNPGDLIVSSSPLVSIAVTPATTSVPETIQIPFTATGTFGDGSTQNLTESVAWTAAPASVATISNVGGRIGVATGVAVGNASITAVFSAQSGTASLTVTNATLTSITIAPANPAINSGQSEQFVATGTFSDSTTQNITNQVTWTSSNVNVAVINSTGLATSAGTGTTTIKAVLNGVNDTTVLTVH